MNKLKVNDVVVVITGKNLGKTGKVLSVNRKTSKVVVEGMNEVKKAVKPSQGNPEGGFTTKNTPLHISNVSLVSPKNNKATKVKIVIGKDKKRIRVAKKCGSEIK